MKNKFTIAASIMLPLSLSMTNLTAAADFSLVGAVGYLSHKLTHFIASKVKKGA